MDSHVFAVTEGEIAYYFPYIHHGIFSEKVTAIKYGKDIVRRNEGQRWSNLVVVEFKLNQPGFIRQEIL